MKFNLGEWRMKPGVNTYNCEQIREVRLSKDETAVYLFTVPYRENIRSMDGPAQEISITSPQPDMIRMQTVHFKGDMRRFPHFDICDQRCKLTFCQTENVIRISSGNTCLVIHKTVPCTFRYYYKNRLITGIGSRFGSSMLSYISTPEGPFMRGQLDVGVGEKIYGMGERFTPFVRNGQVVEIWNEDGGMAGFFACFVSQGCKGRSLAP